MAFCVVNSPVGLLRLEADSAFLSRISFLEASEEEAEPTNQVLIESCNQLQAYFEGKLKLFDLPLSPIGTHFQKKVWTALGHIPYGKSWSYKELAYFLEDPLCIRAAASANGRNPLPIVIPCHRVIGTDGKLVGYGGGLWRKQILLKIEKHPLFAYEQGSLGI